MDNETQEYQMVRITAESHAMLKEICRNEKRGLGDQADLLIEAAYKAMKAEARQFPAAAAGPRERLLTPAVG